jgi:hypothetical protein
VTKNAPEWIDNVAWVKIARRDFVQQRREESEVFTADQHYFYFGAKRDISVQIPCCIKASEAATDDDDPFLHTSIYRPL